MAKLLISGKGGKQWKRQSLVGRQLRQCFVRCAAFAKDISDIIHQSDTEEGAQHLPIEQSCGSVEANQGCCMHESSTSDEIDVPISDPEPEDENFQPTVQHILCRKSVLCRETAPALTNGAGVLRTQTSLNEGTETRCGLRGKQTGQLPKNGSVAGVRRMKAATAPRNGSGASVQTTQAAPAQ